MAKYVALLRGINVGGNSRVEMPRLKLVFENLGYKRVATYINSGNVIFETNQKEKEQQREIEQAIENEFGFKVKVVTRSAKNIITLSEKIPKKWKNDSRQKTDIIFLWESFDNKDSIKLIEINTAIETTFYYPGAIVWNLKRTGYNKSGMRKFIGTPLYKHMTARNVNTVRKIASLFDIKLNKKDKSVG